MKYDIDERFGRFRNFKSPFNLFIVRAENLFLKFYSCFICSNKKVSIKREKVVARDGKKIKCLVIRPKDKKGNLPIIFYLHGGAFTSVPAFHHYKYAKQYAEKTGSVVVLVDYRVSYNSPFNTPLNDCVDAYRYFAENAEKFQIDTSKIAITGDSAGGYLCIMSTISAYELGLTMPKCQLLVYPVLDSKSRTQSMEKFPDTPFWNSRYNKKMWKIYLKGNTVVDPIDMPDLSFMPATYIEATEFDCLHDEAIDLYNKLKQEMCDVRLNDTKGTMHGYDVFTKNPITQEAVQKRIDFFNEQLNGKIEEK